MNSQDTIWILDDDKSIRRVLEKSLNKAGLNTLTFQNGDDLLHRLAQETPDAIISDIRMPGMSGIELQKKLAARSDELLIIFITGHGDVHMAVDAMKAGAYDFFEKPIDDQLLLDAVQKAVKQSAVATLEHVHEAEIHLRQDLLDRKSTRLNSSHKPISYAVFCLKKKTKIYNMMLFMKN